MAEKKEERNFYALIAGAVISAFLASTCCLAPLLFLLFGVSVSSLSFLQVFAPYHGYFSAAAAAIMLYLWTDYLRKRRRSTCCTTSLCRYQLYYLAFGSVLVALFVSYPYWIDRFLEG